ncbi:MAG: hypothetical protein ACRD1F_12095, partial [Terriglobales bacterium]
LSTRAGTAAQLAVQAQTNDLGELEGMADRAGAALGKPLPRLGLAGEGKLEAQISGRLAQPTIAGQLQAARLVVRDTHWKALAGSFSASPSEVRAREISITAPQGSIKLSGSLALEHWRAQAASALTVVLTVTALPLRQLAPLLPGKLPLAGRLDASAHASGTLAAPVGQGTVRLEAAELEVNGASSGLRSARVDVKGAAGAITAQLQAQLEAGSVKAEGVWHPATGAYRAQLSARALELAKIPALGGAHVRGVVRIEGSGEGTVAAPAFKLQVSAPQMAAEGQSIEHLEASLDLQARHLNATLRATTLGAALEAKGAVALHDDWPATASLDAPAIALGPVLAALAPQVGGAIQGETAVQATLSGPLRDPRQLQVAITVPQFHMKYAGALTLAAARPIQAHLAQGVVELEPAEFTGSGTDFHVQGTVPIPALGAAAAAAMQVNLSGNINLKLAEAFAPDLAAGGAVTVEVRATGALAHPALTGVIQISDARLSNPAWPVAVQAGQGALRLHDGRLDLTGFTASVGGGHVTVGGGMTLTPKLAFNFTVAAEQIRLRVPAGLREMVSATVNLTG